MKFKTKVGKRDTGEFEAKSLQKAYEKVLYWNDITVEEVQE